MDRIIMLLEYFYKELIVLCIVIFFLFRYLNKQSKRKNLVIDEKENVEYVAEFGQDISREILVGIFLIVAAIIVLVTAMYYLMPMLLDYILPKDN